MTPDLIKRVVDQRTTIEDIKAEIERLKLFREWQAIALLESRLESLQEKS